MLHASVWTASEKPLNVAVVSALVPGGGDAASQASRGLSANQWRMRTRSGSHCLAYVSEKRQSLTNPDHGVYYSVALAFAHLEVS
jgi:hypothetical protein